MAAHLQVTFFHLLIIFVQIAVSSMIVASRAFISDCKDCFFEPYHTRFFMCGYMICGIIAMMLIAKRCGNYLKGNLNANPIIPNKSNKTPAYFINTLVYSLDKYNHVISVIVFGTGNLFILAMYLTRSLLCNKEIQYYYFNETPSATKATFFNPLFENLSIVIKNILEFVFVASEIPFLCYFSQKASMSTRHWSHHGLAVITGANASIWMFIFLTENRILGAYRYEYTTYSPPHTLRNACATHLTTIDIFEENVEDFTSPISMEFALAAIEVLLHIWVLPVGVKMMFTSDDNDMAIGVVTGLDSAVKLQFPKPQESIKPHTHKGTISSNNYPPAGDEIEFKVLTDSSEESPHQTQIPVKQPKRNTFSHARTRYQPVDANVIRRPTHTSTWSSCDETENANELDPLLLKSTFLNDSRTSYSERSEENDVSDKTLDSVITRTDSEGVLEIEKLIATNTCHNRCTNLQESVMEDGQELSLGTDNVITENSREELPTDDIIKDDCNDMLPEEGNVGEGTATEETDKVMPPVIGITVTENKDKGVFLRVPTTQNEDGDVEPESVTEEYDKGDVLHVKMQTSTENKNKKTSAAAEDDNKDKEVGSQSTAEEKDKDVLDIIGLTDTENNDKEVIGVKCNNAKENDNEVLPRNAENVNGSKDKGSKDLIEDKSILPENMAPKLPVGIGENKTGNDTCSQGPGNEGTVNKSFCGCITNFLEVMFRSRKTIDQATIQKGSASIEVNTPVNDSQSLEDKKHSKRSYRRHQRKKITKTSPTSDVDTHSTCSSTCSCFKCLSCSLKYIFNTYTAIIFGIINLVGHVVFINQQNTTYMNKEIEITSVKIPILIEMSFIHIVGSIVGMRCVMSIFSFKNKRENVPLLTSSDIILIFTLVAKLVWISFEVIIYSSKLNYATAHDISNNTTPTILGTAATIDNSNKWIEFGYPSFILLNCLTSMPHFLTQAIIIYKGQRMHATKIPYYHCIQNNLSFLAMLSLLMWIKESFVGHQYLEVVRNDYGDITVWYTMSELCHPPYVYFLFTSVMLLLRVKNLYREDELTSEMKDGSATSDDIV